MDCSWYAMGSLRLLQSIENPVQKNENHSGTLFPVCSLPPWLKYLKCSGWDSRSSNQLEMFGENTGHENGWNALVEPPTVDIHRETSWETPGTTPKNHFRFAAAIVENGRIGPTSSNRRREHLRERSVFSSKDFKLSFRGTFSVLYKIQVDTQMYHYAGTAYSSITELHIAVTATSAQE